MTNFNIRPQAALRADIFLVGPDDFGSLADVQSFIFDGKLNDFLPSDKQLVVDTVQSLLADGLVEVGDIPQRGETAFAPWPGTVDEVMARFTDRFIGHHHDRHVWQYTIWLNLTSKGRRAAEQLDM